VRRARLENVLGAAGAENVQGEQQQKLDVIANEITAAHARRPRGRGHRRLRGERGAGHPAQRRSGERRYCVLFDPLDGSSNLDVCGGVGTIFSILRHDRRARAPRTRCCSRAPSRSPRATCCTARRRCSC
jgi:fructose-1,6-bisphosphatase I